MTEATAVARKQLLYATEEQYFLSDTIDRTMRNDVLYVARVE
jgi:hypothetical protein